jgi:Carboxypeptidase regulatory-like domain
LNFFKRWMGVSVPVLCLCALLAGVSQPAMAQNATTGELVGTVTDPAGAIVPGAKIHLRSLSQSETRESQTSSAGLYRISLLPPGKYELKVEAKDFEGMVRTVEISLGATQTVDLQLTIGATSQVVTVVEQAPLLQASDASVVTTISETTVQNVPNPGNDITYSALLTPGTTENTAGGFGNFSANGVSATSNLFSVNGMDYNDPYLNLNNSGAANLSLGQNEVQEVSVVTNGYGGLCGKSRAA